MILYVSQAIIIILHQSNQMFKINANRTCIWWSQTLWWIILEFISSNIIINYVESKGQIWTCSDIVMKLRRFFRFSSTRFRWASSTDFICNMLSPGFRVDTFILKNPIKLGKKFNCPDISISYHEIIGLSKSKKKLFSLTIIFRLFTF